MFIFNIEEKTTYQMALKLLYQKIATGDWAWPTDIKISLQCFNFLNKTMQNDPVSRLSWEQMQNHAFFSTTDDKQIPFNIVFDEDPPEGIVFKDNKIFVNTKNPTAYQTLHQAAI